MGQIHPEENVLKEIQRLELEDVKDILQADHLEQEEVDVARLKLGQLIHAIDASGVCYWCCFASLYVRVVCASHE